MFEPLSVFARQPSKNWLASLLCSLFLLKSTCVLVFAIDLENSEETTLAQAQQQAAKTGPKGNKEIVLNGQNLSIEDVVRVARSRVAVRIDSEALERVRRSNELLLLAARQGHSIYGLNRGVGLNKDMVLFRGDTLSPEARQSSEQFNRNLLRSHSAGVGPELDEEIVRATMLARLNTILFGATGCHPEVAALYLEFLNRGIHPVLPSRGSAGVADITLLPHIGLAMMGEGEVVFRGKRMSAGEALKEAGLKPITPFAKDALSILSSNACGAGRAALVIHDVEHLLDVADLVYSLSLEGLNGNLAPLLAPAQRVRPYSGQGETARRIRELLQGSYLWRPDDNRALQDPLSFRDFSQVHGAARDLLAFLKAQVTIQLNSSDDNPAVVLDKAPQGGEAEQTLRYQVRSEALSGVVVPTANFEPIAWVLGFEAVGIALSHVSNMSCYRLIKLDTSYFTKLPRFLSPENSVYGLGILENTSTSLNAEIRQLSNPVSADYFARAGEIEDRATNSALVVERVARIVDNLYYILGMEIFHAAQAVDFRRRGSPDLALGRATKAIYEAYREEVPFLDKDRSLSADIEKSHGFLLAWN